MHIVLLNLNQLQFSNKQREKFPENSKLKFNSESETMCSAQYQDKLENTFFKTIQT